MEMPAKPGRVTAHMAAAACAALIAAASAGAQIFPQSAPRRVAAVPDSSFFRPPSAPDGPAIEPVAADAPESPPTDAPGEEGDLRLVGRVDVNGFATGALQVFHNGAYGAVCSNQFDSVDADVACRQLGFTGGAAIPLALGSIQNSNTQRALIDSILAPMVLENLACTGTEERLVDCPGSQDDDYGFDYTYTYYGINSAGCDPHQATYAFVACGTESGQEQGDVRLVGGMTSEDGNAQFGRLEIFSSGGWGTVCDRSGSNAGFFFGRNRNIAEFTEDSADVACKQLGFAEGSKTQLSRNTMSMEERRIPILVAGATCTGDEDSLTDCPGFGFGNNTDACGLTNNLIISCFNGPNAGKDGELRLVEGSSGAGYEYGRLEIFLRGFWSTICDVRGFTPDSAQVACKALGYDGGSSLEFRQEYSVNEAENQVLVASLPVGLASVDCNGTETSLLNCTSSQRDLQQCGIANTNFTDATVLACANTAASCNKDPPLEEGSVRLRGGFGTPCDPVHTGFVEVYHFEEWGAICTGADNSDLLVADVVCRQLGFPHGTVIDPRTNPADDESNDDPYGFGGYAYAPYEEEAEEEQERFWLNRASCQGPEQKLVDCDLGEGFRSNNGGCTSNPIRLTVACRTFAVEEALEEVTTPGAKDGDVRLVDQASVSNWEVGRLEIFFEGSWSQVCAAKFESADADVACRQLGYGAGSVGPNRANGAAATPDDRLVFPVVALTTVNCNGSESSLLECAPPEGMLRRSDSRDCFGVDGAGLTLACVAEPEAGEEGALRLTDGGDGAAAASGVGVLEIFHAGAWGTVCEGEVDFTGYGYLYGFEYGQSSTFSDSSAGIACRELGFEDGVFSAVSSIPDNVTLLPAWLGSLPCVGVEPTLAQCDGIEFGNTETCGLTQRLVCTSQATPDSSRGEARLTGGSADPGGAWAYGRLEVSDGSFFSSIRDARFNENFGRRGAQVACRSLGFSSGAQITAATLSALPGPSGAVDTIDSISCQGNETSLADCDITAGDGYDYQSLNDEDRAVALICSNPSDCSPSTSPPKQGDIRLVDFSGVISETAPCDPVHFGGVEFFNDGQWGRVCNGRFGDEPEDFIIDAKVICRQLGFPFGSLLDAGEVSGNSGPIGSADYGDYSDPGELVWATDVLCTGKEERLDQCFFPEDFGDSPRGAFGFAPAAAPVQDGVRSAGCRRRDSQLLGVVCRQFELTESDVIRRL